MSLTQLHTLCEPQVLPAALQPQREQYQAEIVVHCQSNSRRARELNERPLVLSRNGEIYVDTTENGGHRVAPYFLPYPDRSYRGFATTTTADAEPIMDWIPTLNWIYVDAQNYQLKYGVRKDADENISGPFDRSTQNHHLTFQAWEGFCAVEAEPNVWAIYFDVNDDGLKGRISPGTRSLEIKLEIKETIHESDSASTLARTMTLETEADETEEAFEEESNRSSFDELDQEHTVHIATSVLCTRLERRGTYVKEELILTVPDSSMDVHQLPAEARILETVFESEDETEMEHISNIEDFAVTRFGLTVIPEEDSTGMRTPEPEVINKLEADVIAMLGPESENYEGSVASSSDAETGLASSTSLETDASSPPDIAPVSSPKLPIENLSLDNECSKRAQSPESKQQDIAYRRDSAIAVVHSPVIYPGSPRHTRPTVVKHRPSRIELDQDELSVVENFSRSLDFGTRPLSLSLYAYTDLRGEPQKESGIKRFLQKLAAGNKRISRGFKTARPYVPIIRCRTPGGFYNMNESDGEGRDKAKRHST